MKNELDGLQFVSCGKRGFQPFPFGWFISVFDNLVWLSVVTFYITVLPFVFYVHQHAVRSGKENTIRYLLVGWDVLLEQGNDILSGCGSIGLKVGSVVFILIGVVLSNAYKNTNVYNMIAPRDQLSYEAIEQLMQDQFTIQCRLIKFDVDMKYYHPRDMDLMEFRHEIYDTNRKLVNASSEIQELLSGNS